MTAPDLSKLTKDELLKLAAKRKIPVKKNLLKNEIVAVLKKEMKKAATTAAPKKVKPKAGKAPLKKPAVKGGRTTAKGPKKAKKSVTAIQPRPKKPAVKTAVKEVAKKPPTKPKPATAKAKVKTAPSKTVSPGKKRQSVSRKKSVATPLSPSSLNTQALHPKFELEDSAQEAKFIIGKPDILDESHAEVFQELPADYGDNKLVLLIRDPHWCFLYWELQPEKIQEGLERLNRPQEEVRHILRIHCPSAGDTYFDVDVDFRAGSHYVQLSPPGASFYSEIGLLDRNGHFAALAVSNTVTLPLDGPSDVIDEKWMTTNETFDEIYALSGGKVVETVKRGSEVFQITRNDRQEMDFSSPSVSSFGSAEIQKPQIKAFNYWLDAELVLFGGADPGSTIKLSGESLNLHPDGTFTARFNLPEGTVNLPVTFVSPDQTEIHTVTPNVNRQTATNSGEVEQ